MDGDCVASPTNLTILSLNCWGIPLPIVCQNYNLRMNAISDALFRNSKYDVICLQEIWSQSLYIKLQEDAKNCHPYSHYFHSGVLGSGVCVFSKWPIVTALFHKWQVNGYVHKITHGDWYGGKGVGLCRIKINGFNVNIYTCHTHAEYTDKAAYISHQVVQAFDIAQFINISSKDADLSILAADLNTEPGDLCYRIITNCTNMRDSFKPGCVEYEGTYACPRNSYHKNNALADRPCGQRIDFILYKEGIKSQVDCVSYITPLSERVPNQSFSYSDHEAICSIFRLRDCCGSIDDHYQWPETSEKLANKSVKEAHDICVHWVNKLEQNICRIKLLLILLLPLMLVVLYALNEFSQSLTLVIMFGAALTLLSFALLITSYLWLNIERNGILCASKEMKILLDSERRQDSEKSIHIFRN